MAGLIPTLPKFLSDNAIEKCAELINTRFQKHEEKIVKSLFNWFSGRRNMSAVKPWVSPSASLMNAEDPVDGDFKFLLVSDDDHLQNVGKTRQGNGFWITQQLVVEQDDTRDFIAAYVFDSDGNLISADVIDQGLRSRPDYLNSKEIIFRMRRKIDASEKGQIWVKPFSVSFYGHSFGLVVRKPDDKSDIECRPVIDAMPGYTLMFHEPWNLCNYAS